MGARGFKMSEGVRIFSTCLVCGGEVGGGGQVQYLSFP